jgi:acyl carrier protein
MKDIILKYVIEHFGKDRTGGDSHTHYSYCSYPFEQCSCKKLDFITYDTSLIGGGYIDSFSMVVVLIFLEKTFKVKIPDIDATPANFDTVNKMAELVTNLK